MQARFAPQCEDADSERLETIINSPQWQMCTEPQVLQGKRGPYPLLFELGTVSEIPAPASSVARCAQSETHRVSVRLLCPQNRRV